MLERFLRAGRPDAELLARAFELDEEERVSQRGNAQREPALGDDEIDDRTGSPRSNVTFSPWRPAGSFFHAFAPSERRDIRLHLDRRTGVIVSTTVR